MKSSLPSVFVVELSVTVQYPHGPFRLLSGPLTALSVRTATTEKGLNKIINASLRTLADTTADRLLDTLDSSASLNSTQVPGDQKNSHTRKTYSGATMESSHE